MKNKELYELNKILKEKKDQLIENYFKKLTEEDKKNIIRNIEIENERIKKQEEKQKEEIMRKIRNIENEIGIKGGNRNDY